MSGSPRDDPDEPSGRPGSSVYRTLVDVVVSGLVVILPLVVTLYVLQVALGFVTSALGPVIRLLRWAGVIQGIKTNGIIEFLLRVGIYSDVTGFLTQIIAVAVLAALIVALGVVARLQYGEQVIDLVDVMIMSIPGIGAVYKSFRRMGDAMLESGIEDYREVKLVEFPREGIFVIGFETNTSPEAIEETADRGEMVTLFLPLAPNPVMGGFLTFVPEDRVMDIDMTVEDAVRTVITSGIATEEGEEFHSLSLVEREYLGDLQLGIGDDWSDEEAGNGQDRDEDRADRRLLGERDADDPDRDEAEPVDRDPDERREG